MKLFLSVILTLMLIGVFGGLKPQAVGGAPSTVRYAIIATDDAGTQYLANLETLTYALQPLDVFNETEVTYNDLFTGANSPKYNLIIWDRWLSINNGDLNIWLSWHYNNGSNLMTFYDGLENLATLRDNFVTGAVSGTTTISKDDWLNITSNPFITTQDFQYDSKDDSNELMCYYTQARLQSGVTSFMIANDTDKVLGWYAEATGVPTLPHGTAQRSQYLMLSQYLIF